MQSLIEGISLKQGIKRTEKFLSSCVAVCGAGGLGSNVAVMLARAGVGKLILIDKDRVDVTNLHRQAFKCGQVGMYKTYALAENIKEINPYVSVITKNIEICADNICEIVKDADIVVEAVDEAALKADIVNGVLSSFKDKYVVAASGIYGFGSFEDIKLKKMGRLYLCEGRGDKISDPWLYGTRVMAFCAMQAHTVLRIISDDR